VVQKRTSPLGLSPVGLSDFLFIPRRIMTDSDSDSESRRDPRLFYLPHSHPPPLDPLPSNFSSLPFPQSLSIVLSKNYTWRNKRGFIRIAGLAFYLGMLMMLGIAITLLPFITSSSSFYYSIPDSSSTTTTSSSSSFLSLSSFLSFGFYLIFLSFFHLLEFLLTALFHPENVTSLSFLLNHSFAFHMASIMAIVEYLIEMFFFPSAKSPLSSSLSFFSLSFGVILVVLGQSLRSTAMWVGGVNFTHVIASRKEERHQLVTRSVYSFCRHPAYAGWFYWSIGMQFVLANPICVIGWAVASWKFFEGRIPYEERTMFAFFGDDYREYHRKVGTGIPFLKTTRW